MLIRLEDISVRVQLPDCAALEKEGGDEMLILTRRKNEAIRLGEDTRIVLVQVKGRQVRIGIECPPHVRVIREEVFQLGCQDNPEVVSGSCEGAISLPKSRAPSRKFST